MIRKLTILLFSILFSNVYSQQITGLVLDAKTGEPLESVSIYFDNTTVGTTTNVEGEFSISYTDAIQSNLVISYLGYQQKIISNYRTINELTIKLHEAINTLDEVLVNADDGLTRKQKLNIFRRQFLGFSKFARSCKIENEDDLILYYNKKENSLTASAIAPVVINNRSLQYKILYDIADFRVDFSHVNPKRDIFNVKGITYRGTTFYENLKNHNTKRIIKNRDLAYEGSYLHFMRALYNKNLKKEGYQIIFKGLPVNPWHFITVEDTETQNLKRVKVRQDIVIKYGHSQSTLHVNIPEFFIDHYGNHSPVLGVVFSGNMGYRRIGDLLPLDYKL